MTKPTIFISHISDEHDLALLLRESIVQDFLHLVDVFVSSDGVSISAGSRWLDEMNKALTEAHVELILCSKKSIQRPWINFEAGAGWIKGIPIVPVCHTDILPHELPVPLSMLQAIRATEDEDLKVLYALIAKTVGCAMPKADFAQLVAQIKSIEDRYRQALQLITSKTMSEIEKKARAGNQDAMIELSLSGSPSAFDILSKIIQDHPKATVRENAIYAITNLHDHRTIGLLGNILLREDLPVVTACAQALGRSRDEAAIPYVIRALDLCVDWVIGQKFAEALSLFSPTEEACRALVRALNRDHFEAKAAQQSLLQYGDYAVPYLIEALADIQSLEGISLAVEGVAIMRDKRALSPLQETRHRVHQMHVEERFKRQLIAEIDNALKTME